MTGTPDRAPRTEEARRDCAPASRAARIRRALQSIAAVAAQMIVTKAAAAGRSAATAAAICMAVGLAGCRSVDEMDMADVPVRNWHHGVELKVSPHDTDTLCDLDLLVR